METTTNKIYGVRRAKTRSILLTLDQSIRSIDIYII